MKSRPNNQLLNIHMTVITTIPNTNQNTNQQASVKFYSIACLQIDRIKTA